MNDIVALLACLDPGITTTTLRRMSQVITAMLTMTGRMTMLGLSRWTERGGSYRTIQRFFYSALPWGVMFWLLFQQYLFNPNSRLPAYLGYDRVPTGCDTKAILP
jgi:hypothetical protein